MKIRASFAVAVAAVCLFFAVSAEAHVDVFGPKSYSAAAGGAPETFTLASPCDGAANAVYTLIVANDGVSSASIRINGNEVVRESDFNQQVATIERNVTLASANTLTVSVKGGKQSGTLTLRIRRHIDLTETVFAEKTYTTTGKSDTFRDSFNVTGTAGSFSIVVKNGTPAVSRGSVRLNGAEVVTEQELSASPAVTKSVTLAAANQLVIDTKSDGAGAKLTVAVVRHVSDSAGPSITLNGLTDGQVIGASPLTVTGTVTDPSGVAALSIDGAAAAVAPDGTFQAEVALDPGENTIVFTAADCEGNETRRELRLVLDTAPSLVILTPADGAAFRPGTVALSGTASAAGGIASVVANGEAMTLGGTSSWSGSLSFDAEGQQIITVIATGTNGRATTASVRISIDDTPPAVAVTYPGNGSDSWFGPGLELAGVVNDAISGVGGVTCDGIAATVDGSAFQCSLTLQPGTNEIVIVATDRVGLTASASRSITRVVDTTPPLISAVVLPEPNAAGWNNSAVRVEFTCSDSGGGGADCSGGRELFADGANQRVTGTARDAAGNTATATAVVNIDATLPSLAVDQEEVFAAATARLTGTATDAVSAIESVTCNGIAAARSGNAFDCSVSLPAGTSIVNVVATDVAGNTATAGVVAKRDDQAPLLNVLTPAPDFVTNDREIVFAAEAVDDDEVASVRVNGQDAELDVDRWFLDLLLATGTNTLVIEARDRAGNTTRLEQTVQVLDRAALSIDAPADFAVLRDATVTVTGTVAGAVTALDVNGIIATISGTQFSAANVPLAQGRTVVTATATTPGGQVVTSSINVYRDSIPPRAVVYSPAEGATVAAQPVTVSGMVDDIVIGTINSGQVQVTVNGVAAEVANRAFIARNIPLTAGANTLTVVATDQAGNSATVTRGITYAANRPRIIVVSGGGQTGEIHAQLAQPLRLRVVDAAGAAVPNTDVTLSVVQNDGTLTAGGQTDRTLTLPSNANGEVTATWTLGGRAGAGNQRVLATAAGYDSAEVHAVGRTGAPALVVADSGNNQFGVSGEPLPRPLVAVVVDEGSNRLAGRQVTFAVAEGGGSFEGGAASVTVTTDSDGRAVVTPILGPDSGNDNNRFTASIGGVAQIAVFTATGRAAGPPELTRISGVVLDNTNMPIPGVTIRIDESTRSATSDAQGAFAFDAAPVGYVKLIVDGSTAQRPGTWPMLEFVMYTNSGQDNTIGMPIYLLPLDVTRGIQVTETTGGTLTFPELPGFSLTVAPGSALFPNGSRAGTVSATLVHADKMPMVPGFGQQPRFIVTIQPPGVHFDPPAKLTLPNLEGMAPGEITELYSFDHDLGQFIAIGTGTVTADGTTIESDPGVGIIKGGWHCGGNPNPTGTTSCLTVSADVSFDPPEDPSATAARPGVATSSVSRRRIAADASFIGARSGVVGGCARITAFGLPVGAGHTYTAWENLTPAISSFVTNAACMGTPTCHAVIRGNQEGVARIKVKYFGPDSVTGTFKEVEVRFVKLNASIKEVSFTGDTEIWRDEPPNVITVPDLLWKSGPVSTPAQPTPLLIAPGDKVKIVAKFSVDPLPVELLNVQFQASVPGKGKWWGTTNIPAGVSEVTVTMDKGGWTLPPVSQNHGLQTFHFSAHPATVFGSCPVTLSAGLANIDVYTTLARIPSAVFLSTLHIATDGPPATTPAQGFNKVWAKFASRSVKSWEGAARPLIYYPAGTAFQGNAESEEGLLKSIGGAGRCGSFGPLMGSAIALNGVTAEHVIVEPNPAYGFECMLVKNWQDVTKSFPGNPPWVFLWQSIGENNMIPPPDPANPDLYGDLRNIAGAPGQNSPTPSQKAHVNHAIIKYNGKWYDPSYGLEYTGEASFQSQALWGYYKQIPGAPVTDKTARPWGAMEIGVTFASNGAIAPLPPTPSPVSPAPVSSATPETDGSQ